MKEEEGFRGGIVARFRFDSLASSTELPCSRVPFIQDVIVSFCLISTIPLLKLSNPVSSAWSGRQGGGRGARAGATARERVPTSLPIATPPAEAAGHIY